MHKLFLNEDGSFKAIACWYVPDNYHMSYYRMYLIPGYLIHHYFTMTLSNQAVVYFPMTCITGMSFSPMTCIAGMSFISHVPPCGNQPHLRSAQEVLIRNTHVLLSAGIVLSFPADQDPLGGCLQKNL